MMTKRKLWMYVGLVLAAALFTFGCGGDDNGLSAEDQARITTAESNAAAAMAQAEAEAEAAAAMAAQMEAEAEAAAAMAAQMEAEAEAAAAKAALTEAQDDLEAAKEAKTMAETAKAIAESEAMAAKEARMAAETAQKEAEDAAEMYKEAAATAMEERDKYKMMYEEATAVDTVGTTVGAAARAVGARIVGAIMDAQTADSDTKEMKAAYIQKGSIKKLMRDDDGLSFNIMQGTTVRLNQDDMADDMPMELDDWQGVALAKTGGGVMQEAVVYSDIERSVTPFSSKYPYTVDENVAVSSTNNTHRVVIDAATVPNDAAVGTARLYVSGASADPRISITHNLSSDLDSRTLSSLRGSYDGVPGQYSCGTATGTAADCMLMWTEDGVRIYAATGALLFRADNIETLIPDPDHLTFGVWMLAPDGPAAGGLIRPIAMANASTFGQMHLSALQGSATYEGEATGYYATRAAGSAEAESGVFTATATLMADFDVAAGTVPDNASGAPSARVAGSAEPTSLTMNRVAETVAPTAALTRYFRPTVVASGVSFAGSKIDSFMDEDDNMMEGWVVNLGGGVLRRPADVMVGTALGSDAAVVEEADIIAAYNAALKAVRDAGTFNGITSGTGGAHEWSGRWDASFHGTNRATLPTGVVGTFQAAAGNANPVDVDGAIDLTDDTGFAGVIGAFGARR